MFEGQLSGAGVVSKSLLAACSLCCMVAFLNGNSAPLLQSRLMCVGKSGRSVTRQDTRNSSGSNSSHKECFGHINIANKMARWM